MRVYASDKSIVEGLQCGACGSYGFIKHQKVGACARQIFQSCGFLDTSINAIFQQ